MNELKYIFRPALIIACCILFSATAKSQILSKINYQSAIEKYNQDSLLKKIDWNIYELMTYVSERQYAKSNIPIDSIITSFKSPILQFDSQGRLLCYLWLKEALPNRSLYLMLTNINEVRVISSQEKFKFIEAYIPILNFMQIAKIRSIHQITPVSEGITNSGQILTEGDHILNADIARQKFGITGTGIRIGVISDGVTQNGQPVTSQNQLEQAATELPEVTNTLNGLNEQGPQLWVMNNSKTPNTAEGAAMLEIVHDLSPDADLLFYTAWPTPIPPGDANFLSEAINALATSGCNVIVDDVASLDQPYFEENSGISAPVFEAINDFVNNGGCYISSAGNYAFNHIENQFSDIDNNTYHNFAQNDEELNFTLQPEQAIFFYCQWSNEWGNASSAINLEIWRNSILGDELVAVSNIPVGGIPFISIGYENQNLLLNQSCYLKLRNAVGPANYRFKIFYFYYHRNPEQELERVSGFVDEYINQNGSIFGHSFFDNSIAVAAISGQPDQPQNNTYEITEDFSSMGPVLLCVDFENQIFEQRNKPDLTAIDNVSVSGAFNFGTPFPGTSASAPHIAAIVGLIKSSYPNLSNEQIKSILNNTAIKVGPYDYNPVTNMSNETGFGRVDAYNALRIGRNENESYSYTQEFIDCYVSDEVRDVIHNPGPPVEDVNINWYGNEFSKQKFQNGAIFYHKGQPNAFWLGEGIWNKWIEINGPASYIGLPLTNEIEDTYNNNYPTVYFHHGKIYWNGTEAIVCPFLANFSADVTEGSLPFTVQFSDESLVENASISNWLWDFGDGTSSTETNPVHTYLSNGIFNVKLTIFDHQHGFEKTKNNYISVFSNQATASIVRIEYFFDNDPGLGNATPLSLTPSPYINLVSNLDVSFISTGLHHLYIRAKDSNGKWSALLSKIVLINQSSALVNLTRLEYCFDSLVEAGSGFSIPFTSNSTINITDNIDLSSLSCGMHIVYFRIKDENGNWSAVHSKQLFVNKSSSLSNITQIEYCFDSLVEQGTGLSIPVSPNSTVNITDNIDLSSLATGLHNVYFRVKDDQGNWSHVLSKQILVIKTLPGELPPITRVEYFIDTDPGIGNASPLNFSPDSDVNITDNIALSTLPMGPHRIYFRAQDTNGNWSSLHFSDFVSEKGFLAVALLEGLYNPQTGYMNKAQDTTGDKFPDYIADQVTIEFREAGFPYNLVHTIQNYNIKTDGSIIATFPANLNGDYYIIIKHRNSIETWSAQPVSFSNGTIYYNFTDNITHAYGNNLKFINGRYCIFAGDANQDGFVDTADMTLVDNDATNFAFGYLASDINGDGMVDTADMTILDNNSFSFVGSIKP